ncbi:lipopolysaccharide biosynthesis protein [Teredinibacter haidensis]|uniref:lipopolysaccharide biosynthesis protein n=1 Tax=Teredinibacter haidensis TaxID=2731755 RepID=UPI0009489236|nr:oligosaccharide flippase family protein [Teredinibacter haidensis]
MCGRSDLKTIGNVFALASGAAVAQLIAIVLMPVIARFYGPEEYGIQGVFLSVVNILVPVSTLMYSMAIVLPKSERGAFLVCKIAILICCFNAAIAAVVLFIFYLIGGGTVFGEAYFSFFFFIPLYIFFYGIHSSAYHVLARRQKFKKIAGINVVQAIVTSGGKALFGLFSSNAFFLIFFHTFGVLIAGLISFSKQDWKTLISELRRGLVTSRDKVVAGFFRDFPKYRSPQVLLNASSMSAPVLLLAFYFSPETSGYYSLAYSLVNIPSGLLGAAVTQVYYPKITKMVRSHQPVRWDIVKATIVLFVVGIPIFCVFIFYGEFIFSVVFGVAWIGAGELSQYLSLMLFMGFVNKPAVAAIPALGIQKGLFVYEIASSFLKVFGFLVSYYVFGLAEICVLVYAIIGAICYGFLILWVVIAAEKI